jgi:Protein of unknown function (DUF3563)
MSKLLELLKSLVTSDDDQYRRRAEEAYLAQSVDNYDLERRMRQIDRGLRWD